MRVCVYRKLRATLDEYTTRVGQQAIVLCISPSKPNPVFKVFGAAPLENVVSARRQRVQHKMQHSYHHLVTALLLSQQPRGCDLSRKNKLNYAN